MSADMDSCSREPAGQESWGQEVQKAEPAQRNLLDVHLQGAEAGAPQSGISSKDMRIMNSFGNDVFERLAGEGAGLAQYSVEPHSRPRSPDGRASAAAWGAGQACHVRGCQGCGQVRQLHVTWGPTLIKAELLKTNIKIII
ncbi:unnamed protein product [Rangifer tarandus platyrhynchus]|uniref:Uncharacterized protein n=2 Tax=Rangifer tarandus platyrhynchus TaxID=3082113 RepID=A0ABN8Z613_RANTA|nr:unnamed protein product [Rangifer tarandus platyrhynchus]CAI9703840.1 unnamed protein product [Rangifer tarandus platyrhynchus]